MAHVRNVHWGEARRLFSRALAAGATRIGFSLCEWDVAGNCQNPYRRVTIGRPHITGERFITVSRHSRTTLEVVMWLPCSQCETCRRKLAYKWRLRARAELETATRTWFGTLTFRPSERYRLLAMASAEYGPGFDGLPERHRFRLIERQGYKEVCKYWKRVRKQSGVRLRYILVAEAHLDGSLHYHALVHERGNEVRHQVLSDQWWCGFTKWKLAQSNDPRTASYVTKYLTKHNQTRTRASVDYGQFALWGKTNEDELERKNDSLGEPDHLPTPPTYGPTGNASRAGIPPSGSDQLRGVDTVLTRSNHDGTTLSSRRGASDCRAPRRLYGDAIADPERTRGGPQAVQLAGISARVTEASK